MPGVQKIQCVRYVHTHANQPTPLYEKAGSAPAYIICGNSPPSHILFMTTTWMGCCFLFPITIQLPQKQMSTHNMFHFTPVSCVPYWLWIF